MSDEISEFDLISRFLRPLATSASAFNLEDDAASIPVPDDKTLVVSKDLLIGNVHFFVDDLPDLIARKALRTNVSDLISKGAKPVFYCLGLGFSTAVTTDYMEAFAQGLAADQELYGMSLLGGDTTKSKSEVFISITAFGYAPAKGPITRLGAKAGDVLYVSGTLGSSALGLLSLMQSDAFSHLKEEWINELQAAYLLPQPPFGLHEAIARYASASMDISDGLFADLAHLCRASKVTAKLDLDILPLSLSVEEAISKNPSLKARALAGGDDYQCLMAIPLKYQNQFEAEAKKRGLKVRAIGECQTAGDDPILALRGGEWVPIEPDGYRHF